MTIGSSAVIGIQYLNGVSKNLNGSVHWAHWQCH